MTTDLDECADISHEPLSCLHELLWVCLEVHVGWDLTLAGQFGTVKNKIRKDAS